MLQFSHPSNRDSTSLVACEGYEVMYVKARTVSGKKYCAQWQSLSLPWLSSLSSAIFSP